MQSLFKSISKKEYFTVGLVAFFLIVLFCLPIFFLNYFPPEEGYVWSGTHILTQGDYNHYFSYIEQVKDGKYLFSNHYSLDDNLNKTLRPEWLSVGLFARLFDLEAKTALQIFRSLAIFIFLFILYVFISFFFKKVKHRWGVFFLTIFSSGLGFYFHLFSGNQSCYAGSFFSCPMDLWVSEMTIFLTLFNSYHIIYSLGLVLIIILLFLLSVKKYNLWYFIIAGGLSNLLFISHPFNLPLVFSLLIAVLIYKIIINRSFFIKPVLGAVIYFLICLPSLGYLIYLFVFDEYAPIIASQNNCPTPSLLITIFSLGPPLLIGLFSIFILIKTKNKKFLFLYVWLIIQLVLIYLPINWQRRMIEGIMIPLGLLTGYVVIYFLEKLKKKNIKVFEILSYPYLIILVFVIFFIMSNIIVYVSDFLIVKDKSIWHYIYLPSYVEEGIEWLDNNVSEDSRIYTDSFTGSFVPAGSGLTVFVGHGVETIDFQKKQKETLWFFYENDKLQAKIDYLENLKIDYIVLSDYPVSYSKENFDNSNFLNTSRNFQKVYKNQGFSVYKYLPGLHSGCGCNK